MRVLFPLLLIGVLPGCGQREPGTASEAEAEALNKAAADLEAQAPPAVKLSDK
jgi:hypothetical protein